MKQLMKNPIGITPKHEIPVLLGIKQFVHVLPKETDNILLMKSKIDELQKIFTRITFKQCLLFTNSQSKTESYGNYLNKTGWKNEIINGAQDQSHRLDVLDKLIKFKCRILITTDLMARGIDIENINLIINLDLPYDCYTYLHRIGRAGRFGSHGIAVSFINGDNELDTFQKMLGDIGGKSLKAMKFPDESAPYDFWNFQDENILDTISGLSEDENYADKTRNENQSRNKEETMMSNLALLEISRKLVDDDNSKKREVFDLDEVLLEYEQTLKVPENGSANQGLQNKASENEKDIFEKAIKELRLYRTDEETERRTPFHEQPDCVDNVSSEFSANESVLTDTEFSEHEHHSFKEKPTIRRKPHPTFIPETKYDSYSHFACTNYSQWENIYYYQLANIQKYIKAAKK